MTHREQQSNLQQMDDAAILEQIKAGEPLAATTLYERYASELHALVSRKTSAALAPRIDAEDIVQSVFRSFFKRVQHRDYHVPPGEDLWKLFLVMALNKIRNAATHHQAAKRNVRQTISHADHEETLSARNDDHTGPILLQIVIDEALKAFPESVRHVVRLRMECEEVATIAERVGRSKRSVERILQEFREHLSRLLDEDG